MLCVFRKPDKTEEEEASDACPYCEYLLPQTKLDCPECKNNIPYCIITVSIECRLYPSKEHYILSHQFLITKLFCSRDGTCLKMIGQHVQVVIFLPCIPS